MMMTTDDILREIEKNTRSTRNWVRFISIMIIITNLIGGCNEALGGALYG